MTPDVQRYYLPGTGRYTRPDPLGRWEGPDVYSYADENLWPLGIATETTSQERLGASVADLTFPFFWVVVLLQAATLRRHPRLLAVLTPFVFVGTVMIGLVVLVSQGFLCGGDLDASVVGLFAGASATMEGAGLFLRFPGQWDDPTFSSHGLPKGIYYNVHRYYQPGTGRYTRPDPAESADPLSSRLTYTYASSNPLLYKDPLGLKAEFCCRKLDIFFVGPQLGYRHCYIRVNGITTYSLFRENGVGVTYRNDPQRRDAPGNGAPVCADCPPLPRCLDQARCFEEGYQNYPRMSAYNATDGPNSNTFAATLARKCCQGGVPLVFLLGSGRITGLSAANP